jgi:hypothetical protein
MNKKELRKQLELALVKTIEDTLNKIDSENPKKIRKTTYESSKNIAKKFYKTLNSETKVVKAQKNKKIIPLKTPVVKQAKAPNKKAKIVTKSKK